MVVMLDTMAQRYHQLPSALLRSADTFDLWCMDMAMSYQRYLQEQADAKNGHRPQTPQIPINKLQEMMERVKSR